MRTPPRDDPNVLDGAHGTFADRDRTDDAGQPPLVLVFELAQAGSHIETTVLGKLGGGVYVALSAPVAQVNMLYGSEIQLLPGRALASILGDAAAEKYEFEAYQVAGVADRELKLGIV